MSKVMPKLKKMILDLNPEMSISLTNLPGKSGNLEDIATLIELQLSNYGVKTIYNVSEKTIYIMGHKK